MTYKSAIETAAKLRNESDRLRRESGEAVAPYLEQIKSVAVRYAVAKAGPHEDAPGKASDINDVWVNADGSIHIEWSSYWSWGGHADGQFDFPSDVDIDAFEQQCRKKAEEISELKRDAEKQEEIKRAMAVLQQHGVFDERRAEIERMIEAGVKGS